MASKLLAVARRSPRLRSLLLHPASPSHSPSPSPFPSLSPPFLQPSPSTPLGPSFCISPLSNNPPVCSFLRSHHKFFFTGITSQRAFATSVAPEGKEPSETEAVKKDGLKTSSFQIFMSSVATAPALPMVLGITGAVPFLVLTPPIPYFLPLPEVLAVNPIQAQSLYGAAILSFLGGPHWGLAMAGVNASPNHKIFNYASNSLRYVWSVVPSLVAWSALLLSTVPRLQLLICSFGVAFVVDVIFANHGFLPPWYLPLRLLLTGIVILCLSASLIEVLIAEKLEAKKVMKHAP